MQLIGYFRSSAAFRVRIALNLKGIKVDHSFRLRPQKRMILNVTSDGGVAVTHDLAAGVDRRGDGLAAAEGAEVAHPACPRPRERMVEVEIGDITVTDDLAAGVDRRRPARCLERSGRASPEGTEINWNEGPVCRVRVSGMRGHEYREQDEHSTPRPPDTNPRSRARSDYAVEHKEHEAGESLASRCITHGTPPQPPATRMRDRDSQTPMSSSTKGDSVKNLAHPNALVGLPRRAPLR